MVALAVKDEIAGVGVNWGTFLAGFFGGDLQRLTEAETAYLAYLDRYGW